MYKIEKDNDYILINEFNATKIFLLKKYNIDINSEDVYPKIIENALLFSLSMRIWSEKFEESENISFYFKEASSNILNIMILAILDMKIPSLFLLRRTQELLIKSIYYIEHPIEFYKKENDDYFRLFKKDLELKDYLKSYPFDKKYNIDNVEIKKFVIDILNAWDRQYSELSKYVHATNSKYFQNIEYLSDLVFVKEDIIFVNAQIKKLSSMINTLLIVFFFKQYVKFNDKSEKSIIRKSIYNEFEYKSTIVNLFKEI